MALALPLYFAYLFPIMGTFTDKKDGKLLFRQLFDSISCTYTYLIASDYGREAILIDPVREHIKSYQRLLSELQLKLVVAIDTHTHADHITASGALQQALNCRIAMGEQAPAECASLRVKEGDKINLDGIELKTLYTPGHTNDSYSFMMKDRIFTGDTLLIRATGRTDFQGGDAHKQYDSLFNKLLNLPEEMFVYPAHDYNGITVSTIGEEKHCNPRLQVSSAAEYATIMAELKLAKPKMMDVAVPANLKCGLTD